MKEKLKSLFGSQIKVIFVNHMKYLLISVIFNYYTKFRDLD